MDKAKTNCGHIQRYPNGHCPWVNCFNYQGKCSLHSQDPDEEWGSFAQCDDDVSGRGLGMEILRIVNRIPQSQGTFYDQFTKVLSLAIPLAMLLEHRMCEAFEYGIEDMLGTLITVKECLALAKSHPEWDVHQVMSVQWNLWHSRQCHHSECTFDAHKKARSYITEYGYWGTEWSV